jgi:hypothetical protein
MHSDDTGPTPKSTEDAPPNQSLLDKVYGSVIPWITTKFHDLKPASILNMNKTIGPIWILFLLTLTSFITFLSLVASYKPQAASHMRSYEHLIMPMPSILPQSSLLPISDSSIGAAQTVIGTYFSTAASGVLQTKLVYNDGQGRFCIRTKLGNDWLNVQCLDGANPRSDSPLTVLDWLGGPSIYFITTDNYLSGINYIPLNDTWKLSTLRPQNRLTHPQSQLSSVTWFNGTSSWLYYQDVNSQLREFGLDDCRDIAWRDGSIGLLGLALTGTGIETSKWWLLSDGTEVLEVFMQASGSALHGRVDMEKIWTSHFYAIDGTPNTVSEGGWLYFPDDKNQLRGFGVDDYRNITWRDGSSTPASDRSGIRASRRQSRTNDSAFPPVMYFVKGDYLHFWDSDLPPTNETWHTISETSAFQSMVENNRNPLTSAKSLGFFNILETTNLSWVLDEGDIYVEFPGEACIFDDTHWTNTTSL